MSNQLIKRASVGGYVKADTTGAGNWEIGRIVSFDETHITFKSTIDGSEVKMVRGECYKATAKEHEEALAAGQQEQEEVELEKELLDPALDDTTEIEADLEEVRQLKARLAIEGASSVEDLERAEELGIDLTSEEDPDSTSIVRKDYKSRYLRVKAASGKASQICGDEVSMFLKEKTLEETYGIASEQLDIPLIDLHDRYSHLNPGQQRMVLGNRLRAHYKKLEAADKAAE